MPTACNDDLFELARQGFAEDRRSSAAIPKSYGVLECLYVGQTSKTTQVHNERKARGHS